MWRVNVYVCVRVLLFSRTLILLQTFFVRDFIYGDTEFSLFSMLFYVFVTKQFFLRLISPCGTLYEFFLKIKYTHTYTHIYHIHIS